MQKILIPGHFATELQERCSELPVELVAYDRHGRTTRDPVGATGVFRWWLSPEEGDALIERENDLRWVHSGSAGVDHILTPVFRSRELILTNSSGVHAPSIAEWIVAAMLYFEKGLFDILRQQKERLFEKVERDELATKHVVVIGAGHIASETAARLRPFGVRLTCVRKSVEPHPSFDETVAVNALRDVAPSCDWLIVAVPLSNETRHLVGRDLLAALPPAARLINVARGEIVDEAALIDALRERRIAGAALDVFEREPLPAESPLWAMENVLVLPHTSWRSPRVKERQLALFVDNLRRFLNGEPMRNVVDISRGY